MKIPLLAALVTASLAFTALAPGQETIPIERAQKAAEKVNEGLAKIEGLPVTVDPDFSKPQGIDAEPAGILVVPDKGLEAVQPPESNQIVAVGQLWLKNAAVAQGTSAAPRESLRSVVIEAGEKEHQLWLYILAATKNAAGGYELLVYGKGAEPLVRAPITVSKGKATQVVPIELSGHKDTDDSGVLGLSIVGKYSAELTLVRP